MVVGANVQDRSEESTYWHLVFFDVPFFYYPFSSVTQEIEKVWNSLHKP